MKPRALASKIKNRSVAALRGSSANGLDQRLAHHDLALHDLTKAVQELQAFLGPEHAARHQQIDDSMPAVLNVISTHAGQQRRFQRQLNELASKLDDGPQMAAIHTTLEDQKRQVQELWSRLESARAELLYELRYHQGASTSTSATNTAPVVASIENPARLEAQSATGQIRLNIGCGHVLLEDYLNVDMRALPGVDIVATVDELPFEPGTVAEIHSAHVLEHFPQQDLERRLIPYWSSLLQPGGTFRAIMPDGAAMLESYARGDTSFDVLKEVTYGGQEYEGDFHYSFYSTDSMTELLRRGGFIEVEVEAAARPNGQCLEFQIAAKKASTSTSS
ncbi:MAG TPA: hypothetical protein DEG43_17340 [Acidimicrobiaceae bacterium]|nr:hypothetical protein [Acidimicrobiaceae bacterium]